MQRATENKIILVIRQTNLGSLLTRFSTSDRAEFYVKQSGADFSDYLAEHRQYKQAVADAEQCLSALGRVHTLDRKFLPNFLFGKKDIVVVLGPDGLVANTVKYLNGQPLIGVNPDPQRWEGVLLPFKVADLSKIVPDVFRGRYSLKEVTMAKATLNNGQYLYGVNDLFIGPKTHTSARYEIQLGQHKEQHSSSGIIVSTGLGSTGWFKSLLAGATGVAQALFTQGMGINLGSTTERLRNLMAGATPTLFEQDGRDARIARLFNLENYAWRFPWDANYLRFTVREPFPSTTFSATLVFGEITAQQPMQLVSRMTENGVIFSDGIENDFLDFNSGTQAKISLAEKRGYLVV